MRGYRLQLQWENNQSIKRTTTSGIKLIPCKIRGPFLTYGCSKWLQTTQDDTEHTCREKTCKKRQKCIVCFKWGLRQRIQVGIR